MINITKENIMAEIEGEKLKRCQELDRDVKLMLRKCDDTPVDLIEKKIIDRRRQSYWKRACDL